MTTLTGGQVAGYARKAGFKQPALSLAVAVAYAESNFNTEAKNPGSTATGLWQILASHPEFKGWDLTDPMVNARAAKILWDQSGFKPWASSRGKWSRAEALSQGAVWSNKPVEPTLPDKAFGALDKAITGAIPDSVKDAAGKAGDAAGATVDATKAVGGAVLWLSQPANWLRVAYVGLGGTLVVVGVALIASPITKPIAATALKVAPGVGKLASLGSVA